LADNFFEFIVSKEDVNKRIDLYLAQKIPEISRNRIQRLIEDGFVFINKKNNINSSLRLKTDLEISLQIPPPVQSELIPLETELDIRYEDRDLLIINKPAGIVVHPGAGHKQNTLVNALIYCCKDLSGIGGVERPGIVHRLDKDTSGLLLVAKNDNTHNLLSNMFKERTIKKIYYAITHGKFESKEGIIKKSIGRHPTERKKPCVSEKNSRIAVTCWKVIEVFNKATFLEIDLKTGRTHQIRVHLSSTGNPILGDTLYGGKKKININENDINIKGFTLHAGQINFIHPVNNKNIEIKAEMPEEMQGILNLLKSEKNIKQG